MTQLLVIFPSTTHGIMRVWEGWFRNCLSGLFRRKMRTNLVVGTIFYAEEPNEIGRFGTRTVYDVGQPPTD